MEPRSLAHTHLTNTRPQVSTRLLPLFFVMVIMCYVVGRGWVGVWGGCACVGRGYGAARVCACVDT